MSAERVCQTSPHNRLVPYNDQGNAAMTKRNQSSSYPTKALTSPRDPSSDQTTVHASPTLQATFAGTCIIELSRKHRNKDGCDDAFYFQLLK
ncbi:hypothetical protein OAG82_01555 [Rubripirellula sp.]|nr:hypothetical protein [Rubripirellula sp.]MDB4621520.1 hypothetical protein [Rubripirellula sp.]